MDDESGESMELMEEVPLIELGKIEVIDEDREWFRMSGRRRRTIDIED